MQEKKRKGGGGTDLKGLPWGLQERTWSGMGALVPMDGGENGRSAIDMCESTRNSRQGNNARKSVTLALRVYVPASNQTAALIRIRFHQINKIINLASDFRHRQS